MNYFLNTHHFFSITCSNSKWQYIFFQKISERCFIVKKNNNFFGPYNVWHNWYPMTHWSNCFYTHQSFTLITYNISFIFTYLLHSGRHSTINMNARVYQQLSVPCLWKWSLSIKKKTHLYMIALFSIHFIRPSTSFFFQSQNSVYIFILHLNYRKVYLLEANDTFPKLSADYNRSTTENQIKMRTLDKYIYWAWIKTIENTGQQKNFFFLSRGFQYDIPMYFFPLKPNQQSVEPLHVRNMT